MYLVGSSCAIYVPLTFLFQLPKWVCPTILWPPGYEIVLHPAPPFFQGEIEIENTLSYCNTCLCGGKAYEIYQY